MSDPKSRDLNVVNPASTAEIPPAGGQDNGKTPQADKAKPMAGRVSEAPYSPLLVKPDPN